MSDIFESPPYKRSRAAYYIQCVTEYLVTILLADAYLAKLLKSMGFSDSLIGIVSSLTSLAFLVQLITILLMRHIRNVKMTVILIDISSMLCFMFTYLLPVIPAEGVLKSALVFGTIGGGFLLKYLQLNLYYRWGQSFVRPDGRGIFAARNEAISMAAGVVFTLIVGNMVDYYEKRGRLDRCFLLIASVIGVLTVLDLVMLLSIQRHDQEEAFIQKKSFGDILKNTLGNKNFRNAVIMIVMYDFGRYITVGFLGTFKTQELLLTVGTVQLINICGNSLRCVLSGAMGRWADRTSYAHVYRMGLWLCAFSFFLLMFATKERWWLIIGYTVFYDVSMAGLGANANNMTYSYVPIDYFIPAQAIRSSISGSVGFLASLAGSRILRAVQAGGNRLFGFQLFGQQILAAISLFVILAAIIFNKCVVEKQRIMKQ